MLRFIHIRAVSIWCVREYIIIIVIIIINHCNQFSIRACVCVEFIAVLPQAHMSKLKHYERNAIFVSISFPDK